MPITCTLTPGYNYGLTDTLTGTNLNQLGAPTVAVPDGGSLQFEQAILEDGKTDAPSLAFVNSPYTGFRREAAGVIDWVENKQDVFSFTTDGIRMKSGKHHLGPIWATDGSAGAPSIGFEAHQTSGLWYNAGVWIGDDGIAGIQVRNNGISLVRDTLFSESVTISKHLVVSGDLAVSGKFSGSATNFAVGTQAAPGLPIAGNSDSGLYGPPIGTESTDRIGIAAGGKMVAAFQRNGLNEPHMVLSYRDDDVNRSTSPAILHLEPASAQAAVAFASGEVSSGAGTINTSNAPTTGSFRWVKAYIGTTKVVIPCLPHNWS
ncbi:MAG: hypothetical protein JSS23_12315 [Proteobacteria bacterium]|nr:hypothetical protein [Pseudomonadota bacterium]